MYLNPKSIRTFIGAKDYNQSRQFYIDLGFKEFKTSEKMSFFYKDRFGFYLQDYYVKDWVENSMVFLEVQDLEETLKYVKGLELKEKYPTVNVSGIVKNEWGNEFFIHDPSGILWHIGEFNI
jgi:catechol 2,3-dioxygenase-like lactoylglutathione lyase family enzyme